MAIDDSVWEKRGGYWYRRSEPSKNGRQLVVYPEGCASRPNSVLPPAHAKRRLTVTPARQRGSTEQRRYPGARDSRPDSATLSSCER